MRTLSHSHYDLLLTWFDRFSLDCSTTQPFLLLRMRNSLQQLHGAAATAPPSTPLLLRQHLPAAATTLAAVKAYLLPVYLSSEEIK